MEKNVMEHKIDSMDEDKFYRLEPELSSNLLPIWSFMGVEGYRHSILIDSNSNEVSFYEEGYIRKFIYIENNEAYESYKDNHIRLNSPFDIGRISDIYKSLDEFLNDIDHRKIKKSFIDEIKRRGHLGFPAGVRC